MNKDDIFLKNSEILFLNEERGSININSSVENFIKKILREALMKKASDIHIEPYSNYFRIRYRINGLLVEANKFNLDKLVPMIHRLKIMCNLDIAEKRIPQEGRFEGSFEGKKIDFRVAIIPVFSEQKIVIRILEKEKTLLKFNELGIDDEIYQKIKNKINEKSGMIIITGPMGSGKTTSLYVILNELNKEEKNITTIEDPVEYLIEGVNQVQCRKDLGFDFAEGLKIILRQDSDVIVIGEIRDKETAEIALTASLTGHLIISTMHSKNSAMAIKRLIDLDVNPNIVSSGITGILSQHLVRILCPKCKKIDEEFKEKLKRLKVSEEEFESIKVYKSVGCENCSGTGYIGRKAIAEFFEFEEKKEDNGILKNGLKLVKKGETSLDELLREC